MRNSYSGYISGFYAVLLLSSFALSGCGDVVHNVSTGTGNGGPPAPSPPGAASSVFAYVAETTVGSVSPNIMGLAYLKATIMKTYCPFCAATTGIPAKRMIALMKTAGIRHLRMVADEVGTVIPYVPNSPAMNQTQNEIGDMDFHNFADFVCSVPNLTFSWGVNYLGNTPANATSEAVAINNLLGPDGSVCRGRLTGFEIGNEPDSPGYGPKTVATAEIFAQRWRQFAAAIAGALPSAVFVGPSLGGQVDFATYMPSFILNNSEMLGVLTEHYYQIGTVAQATVAGIVLNAPDPTLSQMAGPSLEAVSAGDRSIPMEINEGSTVANGGAVGVSNTFASAIYAVTNSMDWSTYTYGGGPVTLDYTSGGTPVYGQTYTGGYSPIVDGPSYTGPNPMLTGITLVNLIGPGELEQCSLAAGDANLRCFAVVNGTTTKVILVNQEASQNEQVTTVFPNTIHSASSILMTAPSLSATTEITIQGASIQSDGSFAPAAANNQQITEGTQVITSVPAHSVMVITGN